MPTAQQLCDPLSQARSELLAERTRAGHWEGRLASSALSTATAVSALALIDCNASASDQQERREKRHACLKAGLHWLRERQNPDGGFGDTDLSHSNIATSMLISAAVRLAGELDSCREMLSRCDAYIERQGGIAALRARYGKDKTFAVPILTNCALAGIVEWNEVSPLPFELAVFPQGFFRFLRLPVVSYAIPALVAIGQARFFHRKPRNPFTLAVRRAAVGKSLRVLQRMQPESGGFLEATPLTSFVAMSLASIGQADHAVVRRSEDFLFASMREDGAWPIDTNLATWNTTLSLNALLTNNYDCEAGQEEERCEDDSAYLSTELLDWVLSCQHCEVHPYTGAAPGGWAWTDLSGGVPDVDDTSGALLALAKWVTHPEQQNRLRAQDKSRISAAAAEGIRWLLDIQNRDGGWPTFCRGWGTMPFDRSATDLTAHVIRAMNAWRQLLPGGEDLNSRMSAASEAGFRFLAKHQAQDGFWTPLWFGNQDHPEEENPVYGTSRVLLAYADKSADTNRANEKPAVSGLGWLCKVQNLDGGWGGNGWESSFEGTALAVEAISRLAAANPASFETDDTARLALRSGVAWLIGAIRENRHRKPSPIGFYFAKLWYYEDLYPLIFTAAALSASSRVAGVFETEQTAAPLATASATS